MKLRIESPAIEFECETFNVNASESITFDTPQTTVTQKLNVNGLLTWTQGMTGSGGSGAAIAGNVAVSGGDITADAISIKQHRHQEMGDGNPTGPAIP